MMMMSYSHHNSHSNAHHHHSNQPPYDAYGRPNPYYAQAGYSLQVPNTQPNYGHFPARVDKLELVEQSLYDALTQLNFGKQEDQRHDWFAQEERRKRVIDQIHEGIARFSLDQWFGVLGLPVESSSFELWLYPLFAYSLQHLLQSGQVYVFDVRVVRNQPYLRRVASTQLPLDAQPAEEDQWLPIEHNSHVLASWLRNQPSEAKQFKLTPKQLWDVGIGLNQQSPATLWLAQPIRSLGKVSGLIVFARTDEATQKNSKASAAQPAEEANDAVAEASPVLSQAQIKPFLNSVSELIGHYWGVERHVTLTQQSLNDIEPLDMQSLVDIRHTLNTSYETLLDIQQRVLLDLSHVVDARKGVKKGFSLRVAKQVKKLTKALHLNEKTVDILERAALFAVLYRAFIPEAQLNATGAWPVAVSEQLKQQLPHRQIRVLGSFSQGLGDCWPYLQLQFERWNGSGQPYGLREWNIPLGARILALCVAYSARLEPRRNRNHVLTKAAVLKELSNEAGTLWDPYLVDVLKETQGVRGRNGFSPSPEGQ